MEPRFHVADSNEDWSLFFSPIFCCSILVRPYKTVALVSAVLHELQGLMWSPFRDGVFFNYCCFPISSKWSSHSPLTSSINNAFSPRELLLLGFFFLIWKILCKSKRWCEKIRAILEIVRPVHLAQTAIPHSKLVKWPFSAILMVSLNFSRVSWLCPKCIDLLSCCHVIGTYITIPYSNKTHTHICVC